MKNLIIIVFCLQLISVIDVHGQGWTQINDFTQARRAMIGFSIGNFGYIGTGSDQASGNHRDFWQYNPATDTWTQMANFGGVARFSAAGFSIGTNGYIGAGHQGGVGNLNDFWEWEGSTDSADYNTWTQRSNYPGAAGQDPSSFSIGTNGYIGLGWTTVLHNDFWEWDGDPTSPTFDTWTQKTNFAGGAKYDAAEFVIAGRGYIGTGFGGNGQHLWQFDPTDVSNGLDANGNPMGVWNQMANFGGTARQGAVGFSVCDRGYIGTGGAYTNDFWEYDPSTDSWTQIANFPGTGRILAVAFSIGSIGYVGSGREVGGVHEVDFWEFAGNCTPLPIELISFSAEWQDETYNAAVIEWQTANEINNDYFEIERSIDAINFVSIKQTDGAGNSSQTIEYRELDDDPYKDGVSYYRLKQVDYSGAFSYSHIEALNIPDGLEILHLYPNPVVDNMNVTLLSSLKTNISINIYNSIGQLIENMPKSIEIGITNINLNSLDMGRGNYYLEITTDNKEYRVQRKFIINKDLH